MTKMITCKCCGGQMASSAKTCPNCGGNNKKPLYKKWWLWVIAAIVVIAAASSNGGNDGNGTNNSTTTEENNATTVKETNSAKISMEEFESLSTGITYEEAVAIIGGEGTLSSQVDVVGYDTKLYTWEGEGSFGANANATFQNGKLTSKAQFGLE